MKIGGLYETRYGHGRPEGEADFDGEHPDRGFILSGGDWWFEGVADISVTYVHKKSYKNLVLPEEYLL